MLRFFANGVWLHLPTIFQKKISRAFSYLFELKISRLIILPYCMFFEISTDYLEQFESESGKSYYSSYSDFFLRKYKSISPITSSVIWPCEGYLCDWGLFSEKINSRVKGHLLDLNSIFASQIKNEDGYFFVNIFLHNHNYHRVHSPIMGTISRITTIPGDLIFLRPWFYKQTDVSYPALRNERVIFEILDSSSRVWYLAMVGGFGVGTIMISQHISIGSKVSIGEEIAKFKLGSTVCLATPEILKVQNYLQEIKMGETAV